MKKIFLLSVAATLICSVSFATIRRLQYWGTPVAGVDYATGDAAVAASAAGDTIMVFQSTNTTFTINKKLVVIGTGFYNWVGLAANFNAGLQNIKPLSDFIVIFAPGSDGTILNGCVMQFATTGSTGINNIKILNCMSSNNWSLGNGSNGLNYDNWEFSKCFIQGSISCENGSNIRITNLKLFNCILDGIVGNGGIVLNNVDGQSGIIENCSFRNTGGNLQLRSNLFFIQNCIFHSSVPVGYSNTIFNNNVFFNTPSQSVIGTGNIFNATNDNLYMGFPTIGSNSVDGRYMLKAGSLAIGAGIGGVDCGAFGGVNPYKLSCIPAVPAFYKITAPSSAAGSNPYQITFSVRSNN